MQIPVGKLQTSIGGTLPSMRANFSPPAYKILSLGIPPRSGVFSLWMCVTKLLRSLTTMNSLRMVHGCQRLHYVTLVLHNTVYNTLPRQVGEFRIELASFPI